MTGPTTEAGRALLHMRLSHLEYETSDRTDLMRRHWVEVALKDVEAEARRHALDEAVAAVEGLPTFGRFHPYAAPSAAVDLEAVLAALRGLERGGGGVVECPHRFQNGPGDEWQPCTLRSGHAGGHEWAGGES